MEGRNRRRASQTDLRRKAEKQLSCSTPRAQGASLQPTRTTPERLVHELEVHQAELEIQNEELKNARAELEAALARYTEVFDFAPIGYVTLGAAGLIRSINHTGARLLGQPRRTLVGHGFALFLAVDSRGALGDLLRDAHSSEERPEVEARLAPEIESDRGPLGGRYLRLRASALAGHEPLVLVAFDDVTERKAKEEDLARTEEALRESNRRKDDFLAMLSHELRNPLAPIRNCLFLLAHAEPGSDRAQRAQAIIEQQVTHLTRMVDDLLDVNRITRGKVQLQREHIELGEVVDKTVEAHRSSFEAKGIALVARVEPGQHWLFADLTRVVQAVSNVLGNAEKFTPPGGTVTVSVSAHGERAVIEVRDTGLGIASEVTESLFEPFAQGPQSIERASGGLGLGLAMVKGLVELHGGAVTIQSAGLGQGTTVSMAFPSERPGRPAEPVTAELATGPRRVLIIEDNRDAADSLRDALALVGHEVEVAYDGPSGISAAHRFHPGVVICDVGLPGMDGYEVASRFRSDAELREAHLIALTGYAGPEDRARATAAGFEQHVAKPPTVDGLLELLDRVPRQPGSSAAAAGH